MTLQRRKPLAAKPRAKGNRGELAVRNLLHDYGWRDARRNWQSGGQGGGDLINGPADCHLEVKHCERNQIWKWITQATGECRPTDIPVIVMRDNRHGWWAVAPKDEVDALLELDPRSTYRVVRRQQTAHLWKWIDQAETDAPTGAINALPCVEFTREGADWWKAVPFEDLLALLRVREAA